MIFPFINVYGAYSGTISGFCFAVWIYIGSLFHSTSPEFTKPLHLSVEFCFEPTDPMFLMNNRTVFEAVEIQEKPAIAHLYELSYMYLGTSGFIMTIFVGSIVSLATKTWCFKLKLGAARDLSLAEL